ncbi:MAG: valine--tRNA ligase, partial [Pseudomonadota bacterium]
DDPRYADLVGKDAILPLVGRRLRIVADAYADPEKGTGAVKMTPAHDFNDFEVGKRQGLRAINVMTPRAEMFLEGNAAFLDGCAPTGEAMALEGLDRYAARARIVALAEAQGWLDGIDEDAHVVPHGDRSKVAVEPYLTDQWFVDAKALAREAVAAVREGDTVFHPRNWEKTYFNWLDNIEPWCISRQLWWGHQIPVWYGPDGEIFCEASEAEAAAAARAHYGEDRPLTRDPDVLDTWFSSGLWPMGTLGWPERTEALSRYYPGAVLVTGFDIIFFWVARMMMFGCHFMRDAAEKPVVPFKDVYVHALVRAEDGKKMSKSIGNVIDPLELIDEYGADAMRFTLCALAAMGRDVRMAKSRVAGYRNFATKLWNAARFGEMNDCVPVEGFDPASARRPLNRWIVGETGRLRAAVDAALEAYRFNDAAAALYADVWGVFCDWYVELSKPLLMGEDGAAKDETRAVLAWALDARLKLLHPFMPFITEALWEQRAARPAMLAVTDWPEIGPEAADAACDAEIGRIIGLIEAVRSVRAEMNVPPSAKLPLILTEGSEALEAAVREALPLVERLARVEGFVRGAAPEGSVTAPVPEGAVALPLAGVIDGAKEKARLEKALAKATKEAEGIARKLDNPGFLAKAPEEVVEENRERLDAARAEAARLKAAADRAAALV